MSTITSLAVSNIKKNRTRSVLILISVFLTTVLLCIIASLGNGILQSNRVNAGKLYGDYFGSYSRVTEEQLQKMEKRSEFINIGKSSYVGQVEHQKADMGLSWMDETAQKAANMEDKLESGRMPEKADEIAAQKEFFQQLGIEQPETGDKVSVSSRPDNRSKYQTKEFIISGILASGKGSSLQSAYGAYVSGAFYESQIPKEQRSYTVTFKLKNSVEINADNGKIVLQELAQKCGIEDKNVNENVLYLMYTFDPGTETILFCGMVALLVIIMSVVVIYNIFQAGIIQKIQEYGKIRALGATRKQMRSLIFREGMLVALGGIAAGIVAGTGIGAVVFHKMIETERDTYMAARNLTHVSVVSVPILAVVAVLALFTVWLSLKKPMRIVAAISPVEAVRYEENTSRRKQVRKGKKAISVNGMTLANLSANRNRTIRTICTMGLSCVLFVTLSSLAGNIDNEYNVRMNVEHGRFALGLDYDMNDEAYPENNLVNIQKENLLGTEFQEKLKEIPGVTSVTARILTYAENETEGEMRPTTIQVMNREDFDSVKKQGGSLGNLSYDEVSRKQGIVYGWAYFMEQSGYALDQKVRMYLPDGEKTVPYEAKLMGSMGSADADWVMTEDTWKSLGLSKQPVGVLWVDCSPEDDAQVREALEALLAGMEHVRMASYGDSMEVSKMQTGMMQGGIYGLLAILGVIGFLNMANTIITGVITRKKELGILQATGMTNRQLNQMLQLEGIIFSAGTILVSLVIGTPLGYAAFHYAKEKGFYGMNNYQVPVLEIAVMVLAIVILQVVLSFILSRNIQKDSLVERINYQG